MFVSTGQDALGNNMFAYCNNNPVNTTDSAGMFPKVTPEFLEGFSEWVETALGLLLYVSEVNKKGFLYEYWVDSNNKVRWSRHHTNHGNGKQHPLVPHDHEWHDDNGNNYEDSEWQPPHPDFQAPNSNDKTSKIVTGAVSSAALGYVIYTATKWILASLTASVTGGSSLIAAGVTP